ncbi:hypothetical protein [Ligilactobacillus aviarius]|uniref:Uncharacterized protein n=1 Tax=Ligilactobacillus aviarius TaxID=1606 RepID=A0A179C7L5_9LACO|nr:hypothetical protein [Ligilactobacillus aviarius]OAP98930.1 hypothetical protein A3O08_00415 [Ligilactobacillus aviarius]OAQ00540.1 hypothetical protein A3O09_04275 [Ligilactobacillus aviarius]OAQ00958.1 hypothetical protein A3O07_01885 [Ligilactobacillus aviarius]OAQ03410.1 hypothetical protein A3O13_06600 [Ligilactobacillus aviarius]OAQ05330.1 hypothetical protein A3O10_02780 [Ligilactobacillus aviarius]
MNKKQKQLFEMLIDLKDFEQLIGQAKNESEKIEMINKMLLAMFGEPHYIDRMLKIVTGESEE